MPHDEAFRGSGDEDLGRKGLSSRGCSNKDFWC